MARIATHRMLCSGSDVTLLQLRGADGGHFGPLMQVGTDSIADNKSTCTITVDLTTVFGIFTMPQYEGSNSKSTPTTDALYVITTDSLVDASQALVVRGDETTSAQDFFWMAVGIK